MAAFTSPYYSQHEYFALALIILALHRVPSCNSFHIPSNNASLRQTKLLWPLRENADAAFILDDDSINYTRASRIRTQYGHDAGKHHYQKLLQQNPRDTSAATVIAASDDSMKLLAKVGWSYSQLYDPMMMTNNKTDGDFFEEDITKLHNLLNRSHYRHSSIRRHIFNLPTGVNNNNEDASDGNWDHHLGKYKNDYPMGPSYIRPLVAGQGIDLSTMICDNNGDSDSSSESSPEWLPSLQCLVSLFLLSSCVPTSTFDNSVIGGEETLKLFLRLNIVFICDGRVVPLIHLFPLDIPAMVRQSSSSDDNHNYDSRGNGKNMVLMTDLHPNVLGMTSIPKVTENDTNRTNDDGDEEGAVMYIGPDSLALVHHLHASMLQIEERRHEMQSSPRRILDVCTGSGVQALATLFMLELLNNVDAQPDLAVAVDVNKRALRFTSFNARLNGIDDKIITIPGDLLSGKAYPKSSTSDDICLVEEILSKLTQDETTKKSFQHKHENENEHEQQPKFDIFLANPPFIPVPPERSDHAAFSLRDENSNCDTPNAPRYGLFSSGGASGEDCLRAIVQMGPSLLRTDGGLMVVVSEFMNPPPLSSTYQKAANEDNSLTTKMGEWWGSQLTSSSDGTGILFTNEFAIRSDIYAQRRAVTNDQEDMNVWSNHLHRSGIHSVSPGLLFIQTSNSSNEPRGKGLQLKHYFVPKTKYGSIWTPHNFVGVEFTQRVLLDLFR